METPKTICVLMNALLKVSRKWLIVIFCFFMSMPFVFADGNSNDGPTKTRPYYQDGVWYSYIDNNYHEGRESFEYVYDLENCFRPFYEIHVGIAGLYNPDYKPKFGSKAHFVLSIDGTLIWLAHTTDKSTKLTWNGKTYTPTEQLTTSNFARPILNYEFFHSRTVDGYRYHACDYASKGKDEKGKENMNDPRYGYYVSKTSLNAPDNHDVVDDILYFYGFDRPTHLSGSTNKAALEPDQWTNKNPDKSVTYSTSNYASHWKTVSFDSWYGTKFFTDYSINCIEKNIGMNPSAIKIEKIGASSVARVVADSLRVLLAPHLALIDDNGDQLITEKTIPWVAEQVNVSTPRDSVPFRSFLLNGDWMVKVEFDPTNEPGTTAGVAHSTASVQNMFEVWTKTVPDPNDNRYTKLTSDHATLIDHTQVASGQICGYQGSIYDEDTNPAYDPARFIKVSFKADTTCTRTAKLIFYDSNWYQLDANGNVKKKSGVYDDKMPHLVTINLAGEYKKNPELKWMFNNGIIENNGSIDVTYGFNPDGVTHWDKDGYIVLKAFPFKDDALDTRLKNGQTPCPSNGTVKYFYADDINKAVKRDANGNLLISMSEFNDVTKDLKDKKDLALAQKVEKVKLMAVIESTSECKADTSYITINVHPKHIILAEPATLNTAMCNYDLMSNGAAISNYGSELNFGLTATEDGDETKYNNHNGVLNNKATLYHTGSISMSVASTNTDINSLHGTASLPAYTYTVERGTLYYEKADGDWSNKNNWYSHEDKTQPEGTAYKCVPLGENHDVVINSNCTVSTPNGLTPETTPSGIKALGNFDTDVTTVEDLKWSAASVTLHQGGSLTITPNGAAYISGALGLHNDIKDNLYGRIVIQANENNQGSLIFGSGNPTATVEIVSVGTKDAMDPIWQYRGIPVETMNSISFDSNGGTPMIYEWTEMLQSNPLGNGINEHWLKTNNTGLSGWKGYAFGRLNCTSDYFKSTVTGTLTAATKSVSLAYTDHEANANNKGMNLITNSYTAAIDVASLAATDFGGAEATLYFYNKGTYNDYKDYWNAFEDHSGIWGDVSSKVSVYPISSGAAATGTTVSVIPSGESFFVKTNSTGKSFKFRPGMLKQQNNGAALKAPREAVQFNILTIKVEGGDMKDRVVMMENDNCSRGFDNGYDGSKFFMDGVPQIYATNEFGKTDINCDAVMAGNYIGFAAAKNGVKYTISFDTDRLEGYNKLFLYDTQNGRYIDILAGETYEFTGKHSGEDRRFILMGEREDGSSFTGADKRIEVIGDHAVVCGFDGMDETILISDLSGRVWWQGNTRDGALVQIPSDLAKGVYVISVEKCNTKFVK